MVEKIESRMTSVSVSYDLLYYYIKELTKWGKRAFSMPFDYHYHLKACTALDRLIELKRRMPRGTQTSNLL